MPMNDLSMYAIPISSPQYFHNSFQTTAPVWHHPGQVHYHDPHAHAAQYMYAPYAARNNGFNGFHTPINHIDPAHRLLQQVFSQYAQGGPPGSQPAPGMPPTFANFLNNVVSPNGIQLGDFASSEEAFNSILSGLHRDQDFGATAPRPASANAIAALPRVKATAQILGIPEPNPGDNYNAKVAEKRAEAETGKVAEKKPVGQNASKVEEPAISETCRTCLEETYIGDEVVLLPCRHWYHEECITYWLKEHDVCPTCRKGVVKKGDDPDKIRTYDEEAQNMPAGHVPTPSPPPVQVPESPTAARRAGGGGGGGVGGSHRRRHDGGSGAGGEGSSGPSGLGHRLRGWMGGSGGGSGRR